VASDADIDRPEWQSNPQDLTDEKWDLVADLVAPFSGGGRMGRPVEHDRRDIINAVLYVTATGCQWRALPSSYPHWSTVHRYHLTWSHDGTWEAICDRLRALVREREGRDTDPSAGSIDALSVQGASTVCRGTRAPPTARTSTSHGSTFHTLPGLGKSDPPSHARYHIPSDESADREHRVCRRARRCSVAACV